RPEPGRPGPRGGARPRGTRGAARQGSGEAPGPHEARGAHARATHQRGQRPQPDRGAVRDAGGDDDRRSGRGPHRAQRPLRGPPLGALRGVPRAAAHDAGGRRDLRLRRGPPQPRLPSRLGLRVTLLEAMRASRPVVVTRVGGSADVVEDAVTGRVVPASDPGAFAEALRPVLEDASLAERWGREGRRRWESRYRAERMVRETEALY